MFLHCRSSRIYPTAIKRGNGESLRQSNAAMENHPFIDDFPSHKSPFSSGISQLDMFDDTGYCMMNLLTFESSTEGKYRLSKFPIDSYLGLPPDVQSLEMGMQLNENRCHSSWHHSVKKQPCNVTFQWMTMDHISNICCLYQLSSWSSSSFMILLRIPLVNSRLFSRYEEAPILFSCSVVQQRLD